MESATHPELTLILVSFLIALTMTSIVIVFTKPLLVLRVFLGLFGIY